MASEASLSEADSIFTRITLLDLAVGSERRDLEVGVEMSRVAAMTVVEGRERRDSTRPRPIPRLAPVIR